jgi:hypothetical protein
MRNGFNQGKGLDTSDSETLDGSEVTLGYSEPTSRAHNAGDTRPGADHHQCSMQHFYYLQAISAYHTIGLVSIPAASISTHHYRDTLSSGSLLCGMPPGFFVVVPAGNTAQRFGLCYRLGTCVVPPLSPSERTV